MEKKTLFLLIDLGNTPPWHRNALTRQMADWIQVNKAVLNFENLVILPTKGDTKLCWLEGKFDETDKKQLEEIKDRLQPVLEIALDLKIDRKHLYKEPSPLKKAIADLNARRMKQPNIKIAR